MAVASLVLGIIAIVMSFTGGLGWIGIILAILGIIFGIQGKKDQKHAGLAKAGFITSIIALFWSVIAFIACVICAAGIAGAASLSGY